MPQLFQSVKTNDFSHVLNRSIRSVCIQWLVVLFLSVTFLIMNSQFVHAQSHTNYYYVRSGDTLTTIAFRHSISVQSLMKANNLYSDLIHVGARLTIPTTAPLRLAQVPQVQIAPKTAKQTTVPVPQSTIPKPIAPASRCTQGTYIVQRGDTLYNVAIRSNSNITRIKRCNNLHTDSIWAGQVLVGIYVPTTKQSSAPCNRTSSRCQAIASSNVPITMALDNNSQTAGTSPILN